MGVAATGEKSLGQRNQLRRSTPGCARACSQRWMNIRVTEHVFDPDASGARENKFPFLRPIFSKCIISGILQEQPRSEEHTSELQSLRHLVCRLLLEK